MDIKKECETIILQALEEVGVTNFMLSLLAGGRGIETNHRVDHASYMIDTKGQYGGPHKIEYSKAADNLYNLGAELWLAIRDAKEE